MWLTPTTDALATAPPSRPLKLPEAARRLRLPLHERSQARLTSRWGFDLNTVDAAERAEALLAESPVDVDRLLLAAAVRSSRGDDAGGLRAARDALAVDAGSARAHSTLATLLGRAADLEGARQHADLAVELDADDPVALYNRGLARLTLRRRSDAHADFVRAAALLGLAPQPWWRRWRRSA